MGSVSVQYAVAIAPYADTYCGLGNRGPKRFWHIESMKLMMPTAPLTRINERNFLHRMEDPCIAFENFPERLVSPIRVGI
jgi:hypothetical protein